MSQPLCLIVGFGPGNGLGIARAFGRAGFALALLSRNPGKQAPWQVSLENDGIAARQYSADAANEASLNGAIAKAENELGGTIVLVYNALSATFGKPSTLAPETLVTDFRVNVTGALAAVRAVLPGMKTRGHGSILFTGGGWALQPWDEAASPSIGKAGLRSLAFTLAQELHGTGVRVGTVTICGEVAPGTPFDPDKIGEIFLAMHRAPENEFQTEVVFKGS
ncbi:MAG: SDR family oxidoreductase [Verrucomicrobia bacterium]|nr:SDR family oxidoreductase [Verrucomicrobiota bacterium]